MHDEDGTIHRFSDLLCDTCHAKVMNRIVDHPEGTWKAKPFDPDCDTYVPKDRATIIAVRKVIHDWDGENWTAVKWVLRAGDVIKREELRDLYVFTVRMIFAVQQDLLGKHSMEEVNQCGQNMVDSGATFRGHKVLEHVAGMGERCLP